jgi:hypothetical protein
MSPSTETNGQNFLSRSGSTRDCRANDDDEDIYYRIKELYIKLVIKTSFKNCKFGRYGIDIDRISPRGISSVDYSLV